MTRKAYKTDITDAQWQILEPLIPSAFTRWISSAAIADTHLKKLKLHGSVWVGHIRYNRIGGAVLNSK
jgi:transposase